MLSGQKLLETLLVYCKIEVNNKKSDGLYAKLNANELEQELTNNANLIKMTSGRDGESSGSDSEPSADNLEEEEMEKLVPIKPKPKPVKPLPPNKKNSIVLPQKKEPPQSPSSKTKPVIKEV